MEPKKKHHFSRVSQSPVGCRVDAVGWVVLGVVVIHTPEVGQGTSIHRQGDNWWPRTQEILPLEVNQKDPMEKKKPGQKIQGQQNPF